MSRAPARERRGPGLWGVNTIYRHSSGYLSAPAVRDGMGREDRIFVTGDHLSFDGNCGVRVTPLTIIAGDPTVLRPSLSSTRARTASAPPTSPGSYPGVLPGACARGKGTSSASLLSSFLTLETLP